MTNDDNANQGTATTQRTILGIQGGHLLVEILRHLASAGAIADHLTQRLTDRHAVALGVVVRRFRAAILRGGWGGGGSATGK